MPLYFLQWMGLVAIGLLVYGQTFGFGFVFDDHIFIVNNPFIKTFHNIGLMWHSFPKTRLVGMYSFALNYHFNQLNPSGYHIFNFLVHLAATGLVWALAGLLFEMTQCPAGEVPLRKQLAFVVAVLFLVHPCQTQAVTYISQRFESMATACYLGTVYFYLRARLADSTTSRISLFAVAGVFIVLGFMTKEVVLTLPAMIMAAEWILFPQHNKKIYGALAAVVVLLGVFFVHLVNRGDLHALSSSFISESHDGDYLTPPCYFLTQMRVFLTFMRLLVLPIHQNLDYDYPASTGLFHPPLTALGLAVILSVIALIVRSRRSRPLISFGLAWVLITFSINMVPRPNVIFEHKLYLISFGFFLAATAALTTVMHNRRTLLKILWCVAAVLAVVAYQRNKVWANELGLWQDSVRNSPHKERVNASLGRMYGSLGHYDESILYLSKAIAIKPDNITYENRGVIYALQGQYTKALKDLDTSIAMDPRYPTTYVKRSWVYQSQHDFKEAFKDLETAMRLDAYSVDAYLERGLLWVQLGRPQEGLPDFQKVLDIDPFNASASQYKAYCLSKMGGGAK